MHLHKRGTPVFGLKNWHTRGLEIYWKGTLIEDVPFLLKWFLCATSTLHQHNIKAERPTIHHLIQSGDNVIPGWNPPPLPGSTTTTTTTGTWLHKAVPTSSRSAWKSDLYAGNYVCYLHRYNHRDIKEFARCLKQQDAYPPSTQTAWRMTRRCMTKWKMETFSIFCFCWCFSLLCERPTCNLFPSVALHHADVMSTQSS